MFSLQIRHYWLGWPRREDREGRSSPLNHKEGIRVYPKLGTKGRFPNEFLMREFCHRMLVPTDTLVWSLPLRNTAEQIDLMPFSSRFICRSNRAHRRCHENVLVINRNLKYKLSSSSNTAPWWAVSFSYVFWGVYLPQSVKLEGRKQIPGLELSEVGPPPLHGTPSHFILCR